MSARVWVERGVSFEGDCASWLTDRAGSVNRVLGVPELPEGVTEFAPHPAAIRATFLLALGLAEHVGLAGSCTVREFNYNPTLTPCHAGAACVRYWNLAGYSGPEEWIRWTVLKIRSKRAVRLLWDQGQWTFVRAMALQSPFRRTARVEIVRRFLTALDFVRQHSTGSSVP